MAENNQSSNSHASTLEAMGTFWDTHDFSEYDADGPDVSVSFRRTISIEMSLFEAIEREARQRGVSPETLVNLWLQQKLTDTQQASAA